MFSFVFKKRNRKFIIIIRHTKRSEEEHIYGDGA